MHDVAIAGVAALGIIAALLAGLRLMRRRERSMLNRWAAENGFQFLEIRQRRFLEAAPFCFWTSHRMPNYFVKIKDRDGIERSGWVRLGTMFESVFWEGKKAIRVEWESDRESRRD